MVHLHFHSWSVSIDPKHSAIIRFYVQINGFISYRYVTVFRNTNFRDFHVQPADWKGGQVGTSGKMIVYEPLYEANGILPMRKQRRRSAVQ